MQSGILRREKKYLLIILKTVIIVRKRENCGLNPNMGLILNDKYKNNILISKKIILIVY